VLLRRISPLYMSGPDRCIQNFKSNLVDKVFLRPLVIALQLFRQRLSHKSVKAYATMPIGIIIIPIGNVAG